MATDTIPTYGDVYDLIKSNLSAYTPQYQNADSMSQLTSNYMKALEPTWQAAQNQINQQFNKSAKTSQDYMSNKGLGRSGASYNTLESNEANRGNALSTAYGDLTSQATTNALNAANLGLNEQSLMQTQRNNAVNQLSNLLSQHQNNQYNEAQLTGTYNGQQTLAARQFADQMAAQLMQAYMSGTDNYTLPDYATKRINSLLAGTGDVIDTSQATSLANQISELQALLNTQQSNYNSLASQIASQASQPVFFPSSGLGVSYFGY